MNRFLAICDCGVNAGTGEWEVKNQRDWNVPEFNEEVFDGICENTACDENCKKCVVTRLKESVFEDAY